MILLVLLGGSFTLGVALTTVAMIQLVALAMENATPPLYLCGRILLFAIGAVYALVIFKGNMRIAEWWTAKTSTSRIHV
jgi:hypothetical protein